MKTKNKKLLLTTFIISILTLPILITPAKAQTTDYKIGVKIGHWARYSVKIWWNETSQYEKPQILTEKENIEYTQMNVTDIDENTKNITILITTRYKNGNETHEEREGNIITQEGLGNLIIGANLKVNDTTSTKEETRVQILKTITKSFAGRAREVNYGNWIESGTLLGQGAVEAYWDKETGIQCAAIRTEMTSETEITYIEETSMIATNVWAPEMISPQILLTIAGFVGVVLILFVIFWRTAEKKVNRKKRRGK